MAGAGFYILKNPCTILSVAPATHKSQGGPGWNKDKSVGQKSELNPGSFVICAP